MANYGNALESVAVSSTNTYYSKAIDLKGKHPSFSWHVIWTGGASTPTGTFTLWFSNIENPSTADDTDWVQVPDALNFEDSDGNAVQLSGNSGKIGAVFNPGPLRWHRLKYVNATGTCTLVGHFCTEVRS